MRNVIITGGSRGLGLSMAVTLAAAGYRVIAVARNPTQELASASPRRPPAPAPSNSAPAICPSWTAAALVRGVKADFGPIYGLVNNAGIGTGGVLGNMRESDIQRLVQLNTLSPILLTKHAVPR